jgi:uncharacterized protein YbaR (Trm112 family)
MKASLLRLIRCPDCGVALSLGNAQGTNAEITSGTLRCDACQASFPIEDGLPVILRSDARSERTRRSFGKQWKLHEEQRFENGTPFTVRVRKKGFAIFSRHSPFPIFDP